MPNCITNLRLEEYKKKEVPVGEHIEEVCDMASELLRARKKLAELKKEVESLKPRDSFDGGHSCSLDEEDYNIQGD